MFVLHVLIFIGSFGVPDMRGGETNGRSDFLENNITMNKMFQERRIFFQSRTLRKSRLSETSILNCVLRFINLPAFQRAHLWPTIFSLFRIKFADAWCWMRLKRRFYIPHYKSFSDSIKSLCSLLQPPDTLTRNLYFSSGPMKTSFSLQRGFFPRTHRRRLHLLKFNNNFSCSGSAALRHRMLGIEDFKSRAVAVEKTGVCNVLRSTEREFWKITVFCFRLIYSESRPTGYFSL